MRATPVLLKLALVLFTLPGGTGCRPSAPTPAATRSFYMGVTPWPPDISFEAVEKAYRFVNDECDLVSHQLDRGIPWQEAFDNQPFPPDVQADLTGRLDRTRKGKRVFLSVAPLDLSRLRLNEYWGDATPEATKRAWAARAFDDPAVVRAYVNYCRRVIDLFQPAYFNYAVEGNSKDWAEPAFGAFHRFCAQVYAQLKASHPNLPLMVSLMVGDTKGFYENALPFKNLTDFIALSSYPYPYLGEFVNGSTDPAQLPRAWFEKFRAIAPEKPFAIAETGYIAEFLDMSAFGITKQGRPEWQAQYLDRLATWCHEDRAEFLVWFCAYDYDALLAKLQASGQDVPIARLWRDTGFYSEKDEARPALATWRVWMKRRKD